MEMSNLFRRNILYKTDQKCLTWTLKNVETLEYYFMKIESSQNRDIDFINAIWQFFFNHHLLILRVKAFSHLFFSNLEIELNQT